MSSKYLWLAVTADEYEFPLYIADTAKELAERYGVNTTTVITYTTRKHSGRQNGYKYLKVPND